MENVNQTEMIVENQNTFVETETQLQDAKKDKFKETLFLTSVTGLTAVAAFGGALAIARRKDPIFFKKGISVSKEMPETGAELALRALKYGTLWAVAGCSLITFGIWKLSGASNMQEFRTKMGEILPRITRNNPSQGRTEFDSFKDLFQYLSGEHSSDTSKK